MRRLVMPRRPYVSTYFSPDRGAADIVIGFIDHTTTTLDVAVYSLTHPRIAKAVQDAHERGVAVRVLTDKVQASSKYSMAGDLDEAGLSVRLDHQAGSMHNKFAVSDAALPSRAVALGSFNWTKSADERNAESLVIVRLRAVVQACQDEFGRLWVANAP